MIYYLLVPIFSLLLLVFQATVLDLFSLGKIRLEISLILVIYAGFYLDLVKGGVLSLTLGFFLDCVTSMIPGLFTFFYMVIFFISRNVSYRVYPEGIPFIMMFTFICAFSEGIVIFLLYKFMFDVNIFRDILNMYLPQSLVIAVIGPACFALFHRLEGLLHDGKEK